MTKINNLSSANTEQVSASSSMGWHTSWSLARASWRGNLQFSGLWGTISCQSGDIPDWRWGRTWEAHLWYWWDAHSMSQGNYWRRTTSQWDGFWPALNPWAVSEGWNGWWDRPHWQHIDHGALCVPDGRLADGGTLSSKETYDTIFVTTKVVECMDTEWEQLGRWRWHWGRSIIWNQRIDWRDHISGI